MAGKFSCHIHSYNFQTLLDEEHNIRLMALQALECILRIARGETQWEKTPTEEVVARCKEKFDKLNINEVDEKIIDSPNDAIPGIWSSNQNQFSLNSKKKPVILGIRPDNLWLQYRTMPRDELIEYWKRPFSVDPSVGFYAWLKPHVKLSRQGSIISIKTLLLQIFFKFNF